MSMLVKFAAHGCGPEILQASAEQVQAVLGEMSPALLIAQNQGLHGAIAALNYLIANGCTDESARQMLDSLIDGIKAIDKESSGRVMRELMRS